VIARYGHFAILCFAAIVHLHVLAQVNGCNTDDGGLRPLVSESAILGEKPGSFRPKMGPMPWIFIGDDAKIPTWRSFSLPGGLRHGERGNA
jgi:hypothetical protein